ncbi:hypothetical protein [Nocardia seriolae]|uniref:Uncharacterized protein n=1 Tax=Nocardia seriolae TaxID=37332 RepID=A0A0B8N0H6_9NOCA|nr:hypothetical protein [Nocardia seriolae]MTJ62079.1 hypothetical protein [Nocardia seriolae]MTJ75193.1 hypothetical protein [Nocardia seriolae]MTJ89895.1 hypothetical protein [Nocardia seriolae]MTK33870.1 hypothetical protein [Nocardia seriolae]MTK40030.1 hypothetical protein [Nocardia seriolae]
MRKILPSALLAVAATAALLVLPAGAAQAHACSTAVDLINAAIEQYPNGIDNDGQKALAAKLLAIGANGADKATIAAFATALIDDNVTDLSDAIDAFNASCA